MRAGYVFLTFLCASLTATFTFGAADDWKPVQPSELALKASIVEKDADAEAIFFEVKVTDELDGTLPRTVYANYLRIKIFTEHGVETQGKVELAYAGNQHIRDISARTIKNDGSIVELKKDSIFDRTVVKVGRQKVQAKSFALPGVEPGSIIEYRWTDVRGDQLANYVHLAFDLPIPIQLVKYYIKPLRNPLFPFGMRAVTFHAQMTPFTQEPNGFVSTTMSNVPAFHEEPFMPPENEVRPWMLVYYALDTKLEADRYWQQLSKNFFEEVRTQAKVNDDIKKAAAKIVGDAIEPKDKLARLYDYARLQIKRVNDPTSGLTDEQRQKFKPNDTAADTLKHGVATTGEINVLFLALATAAGFDARYVRLGDRGNSFFDPKFADSYFLRSNNVAVWVDGEWRFFDPSNKYLPFGALRWQEEGVPALISDAKEALFVTTPISPVTFSLRKRSAKMVLSEDGTLEGDVHLIFLGQFGVEMKRDGQSLSQEEREEIVRDLFKDRMSTAEVTKVEVANATDAVSPLAYSCHIKVPGYAQRTGSRLFFQPGVFEFNSRPLFSANERKFPLYWAFPYTEDDTVEIALPDGYELDNADSPGSAAVANFMVNDISIRYAKTDHVLLYQRHMAFAENNNVLLPVKAYSDLKKVFDRFHEQDTHIISLKRSAGQERQQ